MLPNEPLQPTGPALLVFGVVGSAWPARRLNLGFAQTEGARGSVAAFRDSDLSYTDDAGREQNALDWRILQNGPVALFHKAAVLDEAIAWFTRRGYTVATADCGSDPSKQGVLDAITGALGFPAGANLDGFDDYCWQLEVPDEGGFALALLHYDRVVSADRQLAETLLDILARSAWHKLLFGRRLICLVQSDSPSLTFGPVGGRAPTWNPREWFNKDRGL
jgi:hypothetical protein